MTGRDSPVWQHCEYSLPGLRSNGGRSPRIARAWGHPDNGQTRLAQQDGTSGNTALSRYFGPLDLLIDQRLQLCFTEVAQRRAVVSHAGSKTHLRRGETAQSAESVGTACSRHPGQACLQRD